MKLSFVGDTCINGIFSHNIDNGIDLFSKDVKQYLNNADFVVANLEGAAGSMPFVNKKVTNVRNHSLAIKYLHSAGINLFNLANNHIYDCGQEGVMETINKLQSDHISFFGIGNFSKPFSFVKIVEKGNIRIALIGISEYIGNMPSGNSYRILDNKKVKLLKQIVDSAKSKADWVVLNYHGGEEFTLYPSKEKMKILKSLIKKFNIDIIIGHHSHTFQGVETIDEKTVFYSLGNFIFDLKSHQFYDHTSKGAIVSIIFSKERYSFEMIPIAINIKKGMVQKGRSDFLEHIQRISNFTNYKKKWNQDAYRVLFERKTEVNGNGEKGLQQKSIFALFFDISFYKKLLLMLKSPYYFSIYTGAIKYRYFTKKQKGIITHV